MMDVLIGILGFMVPFFLGCVIGCWIRTRNLHGVLFLEHLDEDHVNWELRPFPGWSELGNDDIACFRVKEVKDYNGEENDK